jgi:hypothetical protein
MNPQHPAILAALEELARQTPVETIDELWLFPTRRLGTIESTVLVASAFVEGDEARRRVLTIHHTVRSVAGSKKPLVQQTAAEHGVAPAERIARLVDGVLRRLDEELAALPPRAVKIGGVGERWGELLSELRDVTPEPTAANQP